MVHPAQRARGGDAAQAAAWRDRVLPAHRFSANDFLAMIDRGIIRPEAHVELIEGEVIAMSPSGPRHAEFVDRLIALFANVHDRAQVRVQGSIALSERSVVDPDLVLLRRKDGGYADALPGPDDVLLLIEVAEASLLRDREVKASLYAQSGIADYWIVNLQDASIIVHRDARADHYGYVETVEAPGAVSPLNIPDIRIDVNTLFEK